MVSTRQTAGISEATPPAASTAAPAATDAVVPTTTPAAPSPLTEDPTISSLAQFLVDMDRQQQANIQWQLTDIWMNLDVATLLVRRAASLIDDGQEARVEAYHCKYFADEMAFAAIDRCMQIHGGIALTTDLPIERMWRQQRSYRITEGASEVMRTVIARHVMKAYA